MKIIQGWGGGIEEGDIVGLAGSRSQMFDEFDCRTTVSCNVDVSVFVRHFFDLLHGFFDVMGSLHSSRTLSRELRKLILNVRVSVRWMSEKKITND